MTNTIQAIRPKVLFKKIEERQSDVNVMFKTLIPPSDIGGLTLLENSIIVSLIHLTNSKIFFEFGTYMGATTLLIASNSSEDSKVYTLDIDTPISTNKTGVDIENDDQLRERFHTEGPIYIQRAPGITQSKIHQILTNSLDFDESTYKESIDLIFIDGGHDLETIQSDTEKALVMAKKDAIIIWHDYNSSLHQDVTKFLNFHYSPPSPIYHVEASMIAFMGLGKFQHIISEG